MPTHKSQPRSALWQLGNIVLVSCVTICSNSAFGQDASTINRDGLVFGAGNFGTSDPVRTSGPSEGNAPGESAQRTQPNTARATSSAQNNLRSAPPVAPQAPTEFQKFILESTGKLLPNYGADFFLNSNIYASPSAPVAGDYTLGPGDEIFIHVSGAIDVEHRAVVDRDGIVHIPRVGAVSLAGVRAINVEEVVRTAVSRVFRNFSLSVSLGTLRGITVYVVGHARRPGTYSVPSTSTLISALFESGGPSASGSMRRVQIKRSGKLVKELDLYDFLGKGDKSADVRLIDGDVVVILPALGYVALTGTLENQAIYELRGTGDSLESLLEIAGGVPVLADPRRAYLERVNPSSNLPRYVEEFPLDAKGLARELRPGDLLSVLPIVAEFANAVTLRGSVNQAVRAPFREGMRVSDLIPSRDTLLTRNRLRQQNNALIGQKVRDDKVQRETFQREQAILDKANSVPPKKPNDTAPFEDERKSFVESIGNAYEDINWEYAVVERINRKTLTSTLLPFNLGKAIADTSSSENLALQAGDTVSVFSASDVRIPVSKQRVVVRVEGEVRRPGIYSVEPGETLINIVEKAGGPTPEAYLFGSEFYRDSVQKSQQANLDKLVRRLEQQSLSDSARLSSNASNDSALQLQARLAAEAESRKLLVQRLRELKSTGRLALGLPTIDTNLGQLPSFRLENNDQLVIPSRPDFVQVFGSVNTESALLWRPGKTTSDYLAQAGMSRDTDREGVFIIRVDGTVVSNTDRWFSSISGVEILPGDIIVAPEKSDKESAWTGFIRGAKDFTQIFYNVGLGAAALKTLRQ
ncbi:MAG: SLBB domain-containing protein [Rhodocyclaceae bacterium]|nr:SLBB domain-containing protein [Rhodocyclaceae bacterium]